MTVTECEAVPGVHGLTLATDSVAVTVLPDIGCDIYSVRCLRTGIDVLAKSPWGLRRQSAPLYAATSLEAYLGRYPGGWQLLLPNAGAPAFEHGVEWGFHGEACLLPWDEEARTENSITLSTKLTRAPITVRRVLSVSGGSFHVDETVTNRSEDTIEVVWAHHPAFGPPFIGESTVLTTGARTFVTDASSGHLPPNESFAWPAGSDRDGNAVDLEQLPGLGKTACFGYLTDFETPFFSLTNRMLNLGVAVRWSGELLPHAWYWQERQATAGYPWFREMDVVAVEPASNFPGVGVTELRQAGRCPLTLAPRNARTALVEMTVFNGDSCVVGIDSVGHLLFG